ncbi:MAG: CRISPR-associated endonuclease Cas2 [Candidatus Omnitrophica bacterium]|jgi:CRISPR-associated protein Cas2|nr:CRISPR-associated endonuclease Cas2 [Candidatus Omnitrophota bacterium]
MLVIVSYDVQVSDNSGKRRLRRVAKICKDYGQRVQFSVFECIVDPAQWVVFKRKLIVLINEKEDSLRFYFLGANWQHNVEHVGAKKIFNLEKDALVV